MRYVAVSKLQIFKASLLELQGSTNIEKIFLEGDNPTRTHNIKNALRVLAEEDFSKGISEWGQGCESEQRVSAQASFDTGIYSTILLKESMQGVFGLVTHRRRNLFSVSAWKLLDRRWCGRGSRRMKWASRGNGGSSLISWVKYGSSDQFFNEAKSSQILFGMLTSQ